MKTLSSSLDLYKNGIIKQEEVASIENVAKRYTISLPESVYQLMNHFEKNDPIYKQYIPDPAELTTTPDENVDPISDDPHEVTKGLIHRYHDRALFKITPTCAVYCRFCFRREMVGRGKKALTNADIERALDYIETAPQIQEVILSGGDPLILSPRRLKSVIERLNDCPHINTIRIHSRTPIAAPHLVTEEMKQVLSQAKHLVIVLHVNHPRELTDHVAAALTILKQTGAMLLSQSVLLKGVNDRTDTLGALFQQLTRLNVTPYYLHHPDKARGTSHFRLSLKAGQEIYNSLRGRIPGYCLPHYVLDIPGGYGKVPINRDWIEPREEGGYTITDKQGHAHIYYD